MQQKSINGSTVLVLGVAYKRDIDDIRESPSLDVMTLLDQKGARVHYADPYVPALTARALARRRTTSRTMKSSR